MHKEEVVRVHNGIFAMEKDEKLNKEIEIIKMYQTEILDLKNTMNEMKTETESTTIRIKQTEERIWEIEDRKLEIIQSEENKEKE